MKNIFKYAVFIASFILIVILAAACGGNPLTFSPARLPEAAAGQDYQVSITINGNNTPVGQIGMDSGTLPAGLNITYERGQNNALISGKPQSAGRFNFTIGAWCMGTNQAGQAGHIDYTLVVK